MPECIKNRWGYAGVTFLVALIFVWTFLIIINGFSHGFENIIPLPFALPALVAALICWPNIPIRSNIRMFGVGVLTVLISFVLIGVCLALYSVVFARESDDLQIALLFPLYGTVFTFGIPYLIGGMVSILFANPSTKTTAKKYSVKKET